MDIRGLVLINSAGVAGVEEAGSSISLALTDVAGKSPLQRIAERLRKFGISPVTAVVEETRDLQSCPEVNSVFSPRDRFWRIAESTFNDLAQAGAELVVLIRLGSYAEIDLERFVQFHIDRHCRVSQALHDTQPLEIFCISASRRNDAASLFRSQLSKCRIDCPLFEHFGYVNPLASAYDQRQFAIDILMARTETAPAGEEIKPGVWVARKGQLEKGSRVLAPAFIGSYATIRSGAVITRCTTVEHHAQVDCGTVVENSSVLPYAYLGAGLDLAHSIAGMKMITNLRRGARVEIHDTKLLGTVVATSGQKLLSSAAELVTYLPKQFLRGLIGGAKTPQPDLSTALHQTSPALGKAAGYQAPACNTDAANEFPSNFVVARTNGHQ